MKKISLASAHIPFKAYLNIFDCLWSERIGRGKYVDQLEKKACDYFKVKNCIAVANGTLADLLVLMALKARENDASKHQVILPALTFVAHANAVILAGLTPVFVDVNDDLQMDKTQAKEAVNKHTLCAFPVHLLGVQCHIPKLKVPILEDCCFVAGTRIKTIDGYKNIENILIGDKVLTRQGYKSVIDFKMTGYKKVITNIGLTGTPDHPVITKKEVKRLDSLIASDTIYKWNEKLSYIEEKSITDILLQKEGKQEFISGHTHLINHQDRCIDKYGLISLVQFLRDIAFITKMTTLSIIQSTILNWFQYPLTHECMQANPIELKLQKIILNSQEKKLSYGIRVQQEENLQEELVECRTRIEKFLEKNVLRVKNNTRHTFQSDLNSAQEYAKTDQEYAHVYNLTVESCHEFFANDILVHNCEAMGGNTPTGKFGTYGLAGTFSMYPSHTITTGEGGLILTNDDEFAKLIRSIHNHGKNIGSSDFNFDHIGINAKMTNMQAAIGCAVFDTIDEVNDRRKKNVKLYNKLLNQDFLASAPHGYPVIYPDKEQRDWALECLEDHGIEARKLMSCVPNLKPYQDLGFGVKGYNAQRLADCGLFLPLHQRLTHSDIERICDVIIRP